MITPRSTRPTLALGLALGLSLAVVLAQSGCTTSNSDSDSELSTGDLAAESLDDSIDTPKADASTGDVAADLGSDSGMGSEAKASGDATTGDADLALGDDAGAAPLVSDSDAKLTQQLANEDLTDNGGFDQDAAERKPVAAAGAEPLVSSPSIDMSPVSEPAPVADAGAPAAADAGQSAQATQASAPTGTGEPVTITNLKYVSGEGGGTVVIQTSAPATYQTREVPTQNQVVVEIENAKLPKALKRPFTTKDFNQPIASMNAYQDAGSTTARVVIQFRKPQQADVKQSGNTLTVASLGEGATSTAQADGNGEDGEMADNGKGDPRILPSSATDPTGFDNTKFYGRPISIEVRDTPVRDVINLIAEQSGANIVLAGDVDGNISLKLRQVPWDEALLIVMKTRGLGYVRQGSILRVAPYDSLQREVDAARKVADAQKAAEPLRVKVIPVGYAKVADLEKQISAFLTKERGKVVSDPRTNSLIVTDTVEVLARVSNLVKAIDTPPLQVMIEGKVIEAREVFTRNLGINWGWDGQDVDAGGGRYLSQNLKINNGTNANAALGATSTISFGTLDVFGSLSASLRLYESEDVVHVISSPRVVVLNNEAANIVQGTNIPISSSTISGGTTTTTQSYIPIEMKLDVTPQVTSENDIILNIDIKRDFVGNNNSPPDINKREAKTKVLVRNGSTAVVGGVYQSDTTDSDAGVPWLRNLPVFGWLFKQRSTNNNKTEMLVFLTPRILNAETAIQKENTL